MVVLNYTGEEINAKIVYYGPGLSGKTTNLEFLYGQMPADSKGQMVSMKTRTDRTLFFDFFPLELGEISGYRARFLLYTVPGQVYYNATRKLVLKGADAVVFIADSDPSKLQENIDSLRNLEDNLNEHGLSLDNIPWIIQYNKRDLPEAAPVATLHQHLNLLNVPAFEAVANTGQGVHETFKSIADILYEKLKEKLESGEAISRAGDDDLPGMPAGPAAKPDDMIENIDNVLKEVDDAPVPPPQTPPVTPQDVLQPTVTQNNQQNKPVTPTATAIPATAAPAEQPVYPTRVSPVPQPPVPPGPVATSEENKPVTENAPVQQSYSQPRSQPRSQSVDSSRDATQSAHDVDSSPDATRPVDSSRDATQSAHDVDSSPDATRPVDSSRDATQPRSKPWERPDPRADTRVQETETNNSAVPTAESPGENSGNPAFSFTGQEAEESPDVGRLVKLDESADSATDVAPEHTPEFITDPMQRGTITAEQPEIQADEAPVVTDPKPQDEDLELVVPVVISRSQMNKTIPLKLRLEIRVVDD